MHIRFMSEETPWIGNGNVEEAVELLYYCNYGPESDGTPQFTGEMAERADDMGQHIFNLSDDEILSADCILLDPKLLLTFRHCYDEDGFTFVQGVNPISVYHDAKVNRAKISLFSNSELETESRSRLMISMAENALMVNLFHRNTGLPGLRALWLWQCQMHIIHDRFHGLIRPGWARKVEVIHNWIRFFTRHPSVQQIRRMEDMFWIEAHRARRGVYDHFYHPEFEDFVLVYGGLKTAIIGCGARWALLRDIMGTLNDPVEEVAETRISIQDHAGKFDAKFICSGPFKFRLTCDLTSHLTFSRNDDQTILLFSDSQQYPGARLFIFKNNLIIGR
jgi:hypothetical protein